MAHIIPDTWSATLAFVVVKQNAEIIVKKKLAAVRPILQDLNRPAKLLLNLCLSLAPYAVCFRPF